MAWIEDLLKDSLPLVGSELAERWDQLYAFIFGISLIFFAIVILAIVIFCFLYRARPGHKSTFIDHHAGLEIVWTLIPTIIVVIFFGWGWLIYDRMITIPKDAFEIRVLAQSWSWTFQYDDGRTLMNKVVVPANKSVKLVMTSRKDDVIHSFFVPNLRIKQDVVPGMYTYLWFNAKVIGQHQVFCAEYCGTQHWNMMAKVIVLDQRDFRRWLRGEEVAFPGPVGVGSLAVRKNNRSFATFHAKPVKLVDQGRQLVRVRGCNACHSQDGSIKLGPSYRKLFGHEILLADGSSVLADENYIRESIENPRAKVVKGFEKLIMPSFEGQFDDMEMSAVVAYIKSLR